MSPHRRTAKLGNLGATLAAGAIMLLSVACGSATPVSSVSPTLPTTLAPTSAIGPTTSLSAQSPVSTPPSALPTSGNAIAITGGELHTCALVAGGGVKCWGQNDKGQLGDGTTTMSRVPVDVSGLTSGATAIAAGWDHTCAVTSAGGVKCWGNNQFAQLGNGTTTDSSTPVDVKGLTSPVTAIAADGSTIAGHTCVLTSAGGVRCWGAVVKAQPDSGVPTDIKGLTSGVTAITAGANSACALTKAGEVECWLYGGVPTGIAGLTNGVTAISEHNVETCALTSAGGAKCWGVNIYGELGNVTLENTSDIPVDVSGLASGVTAIAVGGTHVCAIVAGGGVKCWGYGGDGELGNGATTNSTMPVDVNGITSGALVIASGGVHTCVIMSGGGVKCWGHNQYGELGDGVTADGTTMFQSSVPIDVTFDGTGL